MQIMILFQKLKIKNNARNVRFDKLTQLMKHLKFEVKNTDVQEVFL